MSDLKSPRLIIAKGFLFLLCGMLAAGLLLLPEGEDGAAGAEEVPQTDIQEAAAGDIEVRGHEHPLSE